MGRYAKDAGGSDFVQAPPGNHVARCIRIIDLGTQHDEYQGKPVVRNQVLITWELCNEHMDDGQPFIVSRFYTNSLSEKSNLRPDLEAWRGLAFTDEQLKGFDLQTILGKPCMLSVIHADNGKARVAGVAAMPKGMQAPACVNKPYAWWIDEWDQARFEALSDGIRKIIERSDEFKARGKTDQQPTMKGIQDMDSDVPF